MSVSTMGWLASRAAFCGFLITLMGGCRTVAESYSPWTAGVGIKVAPAMTLGDADGSPTIHPTVSYSRMEGGSNWFEAGAQVRWPLTVGGREVWAGAEGMIGRSGSTGFAGSALVGLPMGDNRWKPSLFASAGFTRYGTTGKVVSAGIDLQPWFFPW